MKFNLLYVPHFKLNVRAVKMISIQFDLYVSLSQNYGNNSGTKKNTNKTSLKSF